MTDRDSQIQEIIEKNPGIQFREIMRSSGLKNGVLSHYLDKLERNGVIKAARGPRQDRKSTRLNSSHSQQSRMPSSA